MACKIGGEIMGVERKKYCVNGEWKESKTTKWMEVTNSSTGEVMAEVPCCRGSRRGNRFCTGCFPGVVSEIFKRKNTDDV